MTFSSRLFSLARPAIFALDPEAGHRLAIGALQKVPAGGRKGSKAEITKGIEGAARFVSGKGRGGDFDDV